MNKTVVDCPSCGQKMRVPADKHIRFTCPKCLSEWEYGKTILDTNAQNTEALKEDEDPSWFWILDLISLWVTVPLFALLHHIIPNPDWTFNLDRILLFSATMIFVIIIIRAFHEYVILGLLFGLGTLIYGEFKNKYDFEDLFRDYKTIVFSIFTETEPEVIPQRITSRFIRESAFIEAINYNDPAVRNYALGAVRKHFLRQQREISDYRITIQAFAIFKEINNNWNYVNDPANEEYFAKASETLSHLSGDCDDHSIIMAACLKAIGAKVRLIHTTGHVYPELYIGNRNDKSNIEVLIRFYLFPYIPSGEKLHFREYSDGRIWLNLDYTAKYPGGNYLSPEILGILEL